jgi:oligosaccharide translocation protein RFT1
MAPSTRSATKADPSESTLSNVLVTGRSLVLLQLLSRVLTFGLNQTLVRLAPPEVFGTAAIQFDLLCSTILFLSREGIRNALLRLKANNQEGARQGIDPRNAAAKEKQVTALAKVPLLLGSIVASFVCSVYLYSSGASTTNQRDFHLSLALYVASSLVELGIEPLYIRTLRATPSRLRVRVQAEGGMAIVKSIITVLAIIGFEKQGRRPLLAFALGQLSGALWLAARYVIEYVGPRDQGTLPLTTIE